jgi:micrococcal nuclease
MTPENGCDRQARYGRTLADVLLPDGTNVNHSLVKEGWCWWYRKYAPNDTDLQRLQTEARQARKGLWNDPAPIPPWIYRKMRQKKGKNLSDLVPLDATSER